MDSKALKCGFFELDITPPLGCIIPGSFSARYANQLQDRLFVRAAVVRSDATELAIASIDACGITLDITQRIRERVTAFTTIPPENVMVMATHAHGGGPVLNWGEEVVRNEAYLQVLVEKTADAIATAWDRADDTQLSIGRTLLEDVSFIRVYRMKDGSLKTNPGVGNPDIKAPTTTIDPEVLVLAAKQGDAYVGAIVNFANHPAIVCKRRITGDYISSLCEAMKAKFGSHFVTVFINGACGNINHINPFDPTSVLPGREKVVGQRLAESVAEAMAAATPLPDTTLACKTGSITVHFRKPSAEDLLNAKQVFDGLGDGLLDSVPVTPGYIETFFALQVFLAQADKRTQREIALQLFRIGNCYIFGTPCQIFVEFGKRMKAACPGYGFVSAFANDYCGYVPTPECIVPGVYEARLAPTSALEPATGDILTDAMIDLCRQCQ